MPSQVTAFTSKSTVNVGATTVVELPAAEINSVRIETNDISALSSLLPAKKQRAPSLPTSGADKPRFLERSSSTGSCKSSGYGHHHAAVIALSDLDKALNMEEELFSENRGEDDLSPVPTLSLSPDFLPCEFPDPTHPILSASGTAPSVSSKMEYIANPSLNVLSKSKVNDDASDVKLRLGDPKSNHQIRDIVAEEQQYIQLLGQPTTVQITETGDVVTTSDASLNMHLVETNAQVKLERPNAMQEANFVHTLKVEDSQQLKVEVEYVIYYYTYSHLWHF
ncbi:unnamed protein product [Onchocerca flexuosa]|uniref:Uncharacterized protein n=1 Tax=Onchocerca flexuosa TaxID=387005 RepID=A0A183HH23_9BILA|nr:unnamed protein product [Onchocerca flexuosa]